MPFRLVATDANTEAAVRRIAREQIDHALSALDRMDRDSEEAVHALRKCCKKLRGLIRLVRPCFADYAAENAAIRDIAGLFSASRDAAVMAATFDALRTDQDDQAIAMLRAASLHGVCASDDPATHVGEARLRLTALRERVDRWAIDGDGWAALSPGLLRTYRAARTAMKHARGTDDADAHHEWRKRVKDHWYQARLLLCLWPEAMSAHADAASRLADVLGEHHDLAVFEARLIAIGGDAEASARMLGRARARQAMLERDAEHLGARLFADKPRAFARRWHRWWRVWRDER